MVNYVLLSMQSIDGLNTYNNSERWENLVYKVSNTICYIMEYWMFRSCK